MIAPPLHHLGIAQPATRRCEVCEVTRPVGEFPRGSQICIACEIVPPQPACVVAFCELAGTLGFPAVVWVLKTLPTREGLMACEEQALTVERTDPRRGLAERLAASLKAWRLGGPKRAEQVWATDCDACAQLLATGDCGPCQGCERHPPEPERVYARGRLGALVEVG